MAYFANLRQSLGDLLSAGPKKNKRPTMSTNSSSSSLKERLGRDRMNPNERTFDWLHRYSPKKEAKEAKTPNVLRVKGSKVTKQYLATPNSVTKSAKSHGGFWNQFLPGRLSLSPQKQPEEDFEGDTLVGDDENIKDLRSSPTKLDADTLSGPKTPKFKHIKAVKESSDPKHHDEDEEEQNMNNWGKGEVWIFEKLNMRGFESLMDTSWAMDFITFPANLFSPHPHQIFINAVSSRDYHARKAFRDLLSIGPNSRDRLSRSLAPEPTIHRDLATYEKWSLQDASLSHTPHIPLLAMTPAAPNESVSSVVWRCHDQMRDLGRQYRELFLAENPKSRKENATKQELPTIYGVVIKQNVFAFFTWDSGAANKPDRSVGIFDLKQKDQDLWHGLAIAIFFVKVRNDLMELRADGWIGDEVIEADPDA